MKKLLTISVGAILVLSTSSLMYGEGEYDWVKDHIVVRSSEKVRCGADGEPIEVNIVKSSTVTISQTYKEDKKKNKEGVIVTVSKTRVTVATDTNEDITTIKETDSLDGAGMQVTSIVRNKRTPTGRVTTVESRNKHGELVLTRRVVSDKGQDGVTITTVETPDKDGNLVLRETTSSE